MDISEFVKRKRKERKMTQVMLADHAGVGLRFIRDLEQGKASLRLDKVNQVLDMFNSRLEPRETAREDRMQWNDVKPISDDRELEFAVFCIENLAERLGKPSSAVYRALTGPENILNQYIIPSYDVLHTQGREYIVNDISEVMAERGVKV